MQTQTDDPAHVIADEPALSIRRALHGALWWLWFTCVASDGPHNIKFWHLVRYFHRPHLQHTKGLY